MQVFSYLFVPGALILGKIACKSIKLGRLDQKKCEQVMNILTKLKFKFEATMADIIKQENGILNSHFWGSFRSKLGKYTLF